jgi:hypothetical protein
MTIDPGQILTWFGQNLAILLIPYLIWQTRMMLQVVQSLYGTKGDNGINGRVKELGARSHEHANILQRHDGILERHKERLDSHDRELDGRRS